MRASAALADSGLLRPISKARSAMVQSPASFRSIRLDDLGERPACPPRARLRAPRRTHLDIVPNRLRGLPRPVSRHTHTKAGSPPRHTPLERPGLLGVREASRSWPRQCNATRFAANPWPHLRRSGPCIVSGNGPGRVERLGKPGNRGDAAISLILADLVVLLDRRIEKRTPRLLRRLRCPVAPRRTARSGEREETST